MVLAEVNLACSAVLQHRNILNRDVLESDLPRFVAQNAMNAYGHLLVGQHSWTRFVLAWRAFDRAMLELTAFLWWARDVVRFPAVSPHESLMMRGSIFKMRDSDIFLAFAHMHLPVYLINDGLPLPSSIIRKQPTPRLRNVVAGEVLVHHGEHLVSLFPRSRLLNVLLYALDVKQDLDQHYYPPRLSFGPGFKRQARGVAQRLDDADPTAERARRLARRAMAVENRSQRGEYSFVYRMFLFHSNIFFQCNSCQRTDKQQFDSGDARVRNYRRHQHLSPLALEEAIAPGLVPSASSSFPVAYRTWYSQGYACTESSCAFVDSTFRYAPGRNLGANHGQSLEVHG